MNEIEKMLDYAIKLLSMTDRCPDEKTCSINDAFCFAKDGCKKCWRKYIKEAINEQSMLNR